MKRPADLSKFPHGHCVCIEYYKCGKWITYQWATTTREALEIIDANAGNVGYPMRYQIFTFGDPDLPSIDLAEALA